jgi:threonine/homoserine/homoserine lactone efflux protein
MIDTSNLGLFLAAAVALTVTPGPAVLYIVTRSVSQGRAAGIVSCLGVATGGLVHVLAATLGLSALLATSAAAFKLVKYAGAAYLVWLGIRKLKQPSTLDPSAVVPRHSLLRVYRDGAVVNILNPKTALFFLAFLPQFVIPSRGAVGVQFALLGSLFVSTAVCTDVMWALLAAASGSGSAAIRGSRVGAVPHWNRVPGPWPRLCDDELTTDVEARRTHLNRTKDHGPDRMRDVDDVVTFANRFQPFPHSARPRGIRPSEFKTKGPTRREIGVSFWRSI